MEKFKNWICQSFKEMSEFNSKAWWKHLLFAVIMTLVLFGIKQCAMTASAADTYIIKAGTYCFNDTLTGEYDDFTDTTINIPFVVSVNVDGILLVSSCNAIDLGFIAVEPYGIRDVYYTATSPYESFNLVYADGEWINSEVKVISIISDVEVTAEFYNWFTANTVVLNQEKYVIKQGYYEPYNGGELGYERAEFPIYPVNAYGIGKLSDGRTISGTADAIRIRALDGYVISGFFINSYYPDIGYPVGYWYNQFKKWLSIDEVIFEAPVTEMVYYFAESFEVDRLTYEAFQYVFREVNVVPDVEVEGLWGFNDADFDGLLNIEFSIPIQFVAGEGTYENVAFESIFSLGDGKLRVKSLNGRSMIIYRDGEFTSGFGELLRIVGKQALTNEHYAIFSQLASPVVEMTEITGKWQFKEDVVLPNKMFTVDDYFTFAYVYQNGTTAYMYGNAIGNNPGENTLYYNIYKSTPDLHGYGFTYPFRLDAYNVISGWNETKWHDGITVLDFGYDPVIVTQEFYNWFTANATPYSIIDKDEIGNIQDGLDDITYYDPDNAGDILDPEDFIDPQDPAFVAYGSFMRDLLSNELTLPIMSIVTIFGVIGVILFSRKG